MKTILYCPCGSALNANDCCQQYIAGEAAPTAVALMRSRYTAFAVRNEAYLLSTWHSSTRPISVQFENQLKWLRLAVISTKMIDPATAEVEFIAHYRVGGGSAARHHERSSFVSEQERWFYVNGESIESGRRLSNQ
jgi:SEC-C motif domain protein